MNEGPHPQGEICESTSYVPDHLELLTPKRLGPVSAGMRLSNFLLAGIAAEGMSLLEGDVVVVAQKVVSKAEGRTVALRSVTPSAQAQEIAQVVGKDARLIEVILRESTRVVRQVPGVLIVEHRLGFVMANAGVDQSNSSSGTVILLPADPDRSAAELAADIHAITGHKVAVIVIDSIGRAWRNGTVGQAIGVSGLLPILDLRGRKDLFGRTLQSTQVAIADEIAAAASLLMGQASEGRPIVIVRGLKPACIGTGSIKALLRNPAEDLFK